MSGGLLSWTPDRRSAPYAMPRSSYFRLRVFYITLATIALVAAGFTWRALVMNRASGVQRIDVADVDRVSGRQGFVLGSDSAPVEVIEFSDFACSYCARFAILSMPTVRSRLIRTGLVRWRFWDFPMPYHRNAPVAHRAAGCAAAQSRFWEMHDALFLRQREWRDQRRPDRAIRSFARSVDLDLERFDACMSDTLSAIGIEHARRAAVALGVSAAPTFKIGRNLVAGAIPYDSLRALIDVALREESET